MTILLRALNGKKLISSIFLVLLFFQLAFIPRNFEYSWSGQKAGIVIIAFLAISILLLFQKEKSWSKITFFDSIFLLLISWNFLSFIWATNPSMVWYPSLAWLFLFGVYKIFSIASFQNHQFWYKVLLSILSLNCFLLVWFIVHIYLKKESFGFSYYDFASIGRFFYGNGNLIASTLVLQVPLLLLVYQKLKIAKQFWIFFWALFFIHVFFIIALNSRGALLAFIFQIAVLIPFFYKKRNIKKILIGAVTLILLLLTFTLILKNKSDFIQKYNPLSGTQSEYGDDRLKMWSASWQLSMENPILGVGSGNWAIAYQKFGLGQYYTHVYNNTRYFNHPHSFYFHILSELGWIGFLLFSLIFLIIAKHFFSLWKKQDDAANGIPFALLVSFFVISFFFGVTYSVNTSLATPQFIIFAMFGILSRSDSFIPSFQKLHFPKIILSIVFLIVLVGHNFYKKKEVGIKHFLKLQKQKKYSEAVNQIDKIYSPIFYTASPKKVLQREKANILFHQKEYESALEAIELALIDHPYYHHNWSTKGAILIKLNKWNAAKTAYEKAHALKTHFFGNHLYLARIAIHEKNYEEAKKWLSFFDEKILPYIKIYETNEVWQNNPINKKNYKLHKDYEKQVLKIRSRIPKSNLPEE